MIFCHDAYFAFRCYFTLSRMAAVPRAAAIDCGVSMANIDFCRHCFDDATSHYAIISRFVIVIFAAILLLISGCRHACYERQTCRRFISLRYVYTLLTLFIFADAIIDYYLFRCCHAFSPCFDALRAAAPKMTP